MKKNYHIVIILHILSKYRTIFQPDKMCGSFSVSKKCIKVVWTSCCIILTLTTSIWQLNNYMNGEDLTVVSYRTFHQDEIDVYPSIGLCFSNALVKEKLNNYQITDPKRSNWSISSLKDLYSYFLAGKYWDQDMLLIDYDDASKNIGDYVIRYDIMTGEGKLNTIYDATGQSIYNAGTETREIDKMRMKRQIIPLFMELSFWAMKCVSFDIPFLVNQRVLGAVVEFKPGVFNHGIRPHNGHDNIKDDQFVFAPHYPKQLIKSLLQAETKWPVQAKNKYGVHLTRFNIRAVEIVQRRNKYWKPCTEGTPENDQEIIQWVIKKIGCKAPFWNSTSEMPLCLTKKDLQKTTELLFKVMQGDIKLLNYTRELPCRGLEKYQFEFTDIELKEDEYEITNSTPMVRLEISFKDFSYKEIKNVRSMDLQSLIGILNTNFTLKGLNKRLLF
jgi:hypothetical protein